MIPGEIHFVLSATNCLAVGGHFYTPNTLWETMLSRRNEHLMGALNTNTAHVGGEAIIRDMVAVYHSKLIVPNAKRPCVFSMSPI